MGQGVPPKGSANHLQADYHDPKHMRAFREALLADAPDAISAATDWAPVKQRIRRSPSSASMLASPSPSSSSSSAVSPNYTADAAADVTRAGLAYTLARPPLLAILGFLISLEFWLYVLVRQLVVAFEYTWNWWGVKGRLRQRLREAPTYDEWKATALKLDDYLGFNRWKSKAFYAYYDAQLIRRVRDNLRKLRHANDVEGVKTVLEICLRPNFAGIESARLYSETYFGTKSLVEDYLAELETSLTYVRESERLSAADKKHFFKSVSKHFGSTCLCLSGGASLGYYHLGVARALLDQGELPRIISGTSAGSLVAALLCCRTDEELDTIITPQLANRITAFDEDFMSTMKRLWKTGARFDAATWAEKCSFFTLGSMTFKEAYERTGRILSVSVVPYESSHPTQLLNYLTAPDTCIFSACIASAAVPGLLQPVVLMNKTKSGDIVPGQFSGRHKDGSLRVDIPLQSLHLLFNSNFSVVSQVNPHVSMFFFQPRGSPGRPVTHRKGKGWRGGYLLSAAEQFLKIELTKNFRVIRDLELLPQFAGQNWASVFLQKFEGSVTLFPKIRASDWTRLLTDPDEKELERMIDAGLRATWPKVHMIRNRQKIERQIEQGRQAARDSLSGPSGRQSPAFDPAEITSAFEESDSSGDLPPQPDFNNGDLTSIQGTVAPTNDREAEAIKHEAENSQELSAQEFEARKARRKALMRRLGLTRNTPLGRGPEGHSDFAEHHRRRSLGSLRLGSRSRGDHKVPASSEEDETGFSSA